MFKSVLKLALILLPVFIIIALAEYKASSLPNNYKVKRIIAEREIESAEIIVLGASHSYYGIDTKLFGVPSLNLAYVSQDLYYDHEILFKYLPRAKNLKMVILSVSYPSFEGETVNSVESWRTSYYKRFWKISPKSMLPKLADYSSVALFGIQPSRDYLLKNETPYMERIDDSGNCAETRPVISNLEHKPDRAVERHERTMRSDSTPVNVGYLTEMVEALQSRNIRVILITTPCFHRYYENINPQKYTVMQDVTKSLAQRYNIKYYNYLKDERFNETDFTDIDHLNTDGQQKLTLILKSDIQQNR